MNLIVGVVLIANVTLTSYRSVPAQTKPRGCEWTASGERCNVHGVAVSQNLLARWGGPLHYGDLVYIEGVGFKTVNDVMNPRWHDRCDIWVSAYKDEKKFGIRHGRLWLIKGNLQ